jgi:hypothetical protein
MNIHMATLPRVIQIQIAQPRFSEMNSPAGNQRRPSNFFENFGLQFQKNICEPQKAPASRDQQWVSANNFITIQHSGGNTSKVIQSYFFRQGEGWT